MRNSFSILSLERRATLGLSLIYAFRMLGLFMILPVFSVYAATLSATTPFLVGLTIGVYGASQVLLQIPFGWASDKFGRKPIIMIGLLFFAIGSIIAGSSTTIYGVLIGRAIQGAGAVSSATMALLSDLTQEENRAKAMAMIGMTIGLSFAVAIILGPLLSHYIGVAGIFLVTAGFAFCGMLLLYLLVPTPKISMIHHDSTGSLSQLPTIFFNKMLAQLNISILIQHAILTSTFVAIPIIFHRLEISMSSQSIAGLPVIILAFAISILMIIIAEVRRKIKHIFVACVFILLLSEIGCWATQNLVFGLVFSLFLFFAAFCTLEALLPSMVSKVAPAGLRGTAMGLYATNQFLGIFFGGLLAGWLTQYCSVSVIFLMNGFLLLIWLFIAVLMKTPRYLSTCIFPLSFPYPTREQCLEIVGVVDAAVCRDEGVVYLKIDKDICDVSTLQSCLLEKSSLER